MPGLEGDEGGFTVFDRVLTTFCTCCANHGLLGLAHALDTLTGEVGFPEVGGIWAGAKNIRLKLYTHTYWILWVSTYPQYSKVRAANRKGLGDAIVPLPK